MAASRKTKRPSRRLYCARRIPDPVFESNPEIHHHIFFVPAHTLVPGVSYGPNARKPNARKQVYKKVDDDSLQNVDCLPNTFHLKNLGIVINAHSVKRISDAEYHVELPDEELHGVLNGGHTLDLIVNRVKDGTIDKGQIAGGLNTALQVEDMYLDDLAGAFDWFKEELAHEPYFKEISWSENDNGEYDARDLVSLMTCFDIGQYRNQNTGAHPIEAYEDRQKPHALGNATSDRRFPRLDVEGQCVGVIRRSGRRLLQR